MKPIVAIVGRANVGKSTFFNRVCGKRISIVDDVAGVTRDRIYADAEWCGQYFTVVDTGGIDFSSDDVFQKSIQKQAQIAIDTANVVVFIVDGKTGITKNDEDVAKVLRKSKVPVVLVVNKLDRFDKNDTYEFFGLGLGTPYPLSLTSGKGLGDVLDAIVANFNQTTTEEYSGAKIAIVGRPNVGKSSITNALLGQERTVVSAIEGTTRDAIMTPFRHNKKDYYLVDTAGLRKNKAIENGSIESYSVLRTLSAIEMADVVLVVVDASVPVCEQDVRIAGLVHESGKPSVVVVNKTDIKAKPKEQILQELKQKLAFMDYFECVFVSALNKKGLSQIMQSTETVLANSQKRISTGLLNDVLQEALLNYQPPAKKGKRAKIYYATQASICPPNFVFFVNDAKLFDFSYTGYLENKLREKFDFAGTPIKITLKNKGEK